MQIFRLPNLQISFSAIAEERKDNSEGNFMKQLNENDNEDAGSSNPGSNSENNYEDSNSPSFEIRNFQSDTSESEPIHSIASVISRELVDCRSRSQPKSSREMTDTFL